MAVPDPNAEAVRAALQSAEVERRVLWVASPRVVVFDSKLLNMTEKRAEQCPEASRTYGVHSGCGQP
jgi:hypothetical protein